MRPFKLHWVRRIKFMSSYHTIFHVKVDMWRYIPFERQNSLLVLFKQVLPINIKMSAQLVSSTRGKILVVHLHWWFDPRLDTCWCFFTRTILSSFRTHSFEILSWPFIFPHSPLIDMWHRVSFERDYLSFKRDYLLFERAILVYLKLSMSHFLRCCMRHVNPRSYGVSSTSIAKGKR